MNTNKITAEVKKSYSQKRDVIDNAGWDLIAVLLTIDYFSDAQIRLLICRAIREKRMDFIERYLSLCEDDNVIEEAYASGNLDIVKLINTVVDINDEDYMFVAKQGAGRSGNIDLMVKTINYAPEFWDTIAYGLIQRGDVSLAVDLIDGTAESEITKELEKRTGHSSKQYVDGDLIVVMMSIAVASKQIKPYMILSKYVDLEGDEFNSAIAGLGDLDWLKKMEKDVTHKVTNTLAMWSAIDHGRINIVKYLLSKNIKFGKEQMIERADNAGYDNIVALFK